LWTTCRGAGTSLKSVIIQVVELANANPGTSAVPTPGSTTPAIIAGTVGCGANYPGVRTDWLGLRLALKVFVPVAVVAVVVVLLLFLLQTGRQLAQKRRVVVLAAVC
jgi:phosphate/sulfate permease